MFAAIAGLLRSLFVFVGMVAPKSCFPPPLTPEEETELVERLGNGDAQARAKLIEHNLRLVAHIAKKYQTRERSLDDLISIGTIGLIKAINTFDPKKAANIAAYSSRCVENEILMFLRSEKKHAQEVSLEEPIGTDRDGNEITLSDVIGCDGDSVADEVISSVNARSVRMAVRERLDPRERAVIELRYGLADGVGLAQREVAKRLGISRSYVSRIEKKALTKLNDCLSGSV